MAYFECLHEVSSLGSIYQGGSIANMALTRSAPTAKYGDVTPRPGSSPTETDKKK